MSKKKQQKKHVLITIFIKSSIAESNLKMMYHITLYWPWRCWFVWLSALEGFSFRTYSDQLISNGSIFRIFRDILLLPYPLWFHAFTLIFQKCPHFQTNETFTLYFTPLYPVLCMYPVIYNSQMTLCTLSKWTFRQGTTPKNWICYPRKAILSIVLNIVSSFINLYSLFNLFLSV